ncbi:MAG TPA: trypsin-like peptidase domain-containing protein [Gemmatimonadales bacterium]|nr:trypsin-like peptidase domain-containing protein [Gemmatimonadales bacterium]
MPPRTPSRPVRALRRGAAVWLVAALTACGGGSADSQTPQGRAPAAARSVTARVEASRRTAIVEAVERVSPAVVSISVTARRRRAESPFDFLFIPQSREQVVQGFGTGFIVRPDGIVLTNQHVVGGAETVVVTLGDGTELPASLVGEDPTTDVAVLRVEGRQFPVAPIGRSTDLLTGEWVVALGNPYSYLLGNAEPTVTAGVVSATGRNILPSRDQSGLYLDMIQTDAAINPGNSGGPLVNALGEIVGMNSSIFSQSGGSIGLGFAIPIERALRVADEIVRSGQVRRAWTGVEVAGADAMGDWKSQGGVLVRSVSPGGPGARAGLRAGSVLVAANSRPLRNFLDWEAVKLDLHVGDSVVLGVREDGGTVTRRLVSGDLPTVTAERVRLRQDIDLVTVTPGIRAERQLRSEQGALVVRISEPMAEQAGLAEGDVIVAINRAPVAAAEEVREFLDTLRPGTAFRIYVERGGRYTYTDLVLR